MTYMQPKDEFIPFEREKHNSHFTHFYDVSCALSESWEIVLLNVCQSPLLHYSYTYFVLCS